MQFNNILQDYVEVRFQMALVWKNIYWPTIAMTLCKCMYVPNKHVICCISFVHICALLSIWHDALTNSHEHKCYSVQLQFIKTWMYFATWWFNVAWCIIQELYDNWFNEMQYAWRNDLYGQGQETQVAATPTILMSPSLITVQKGS